MDERISRGGLAAKLVETRRGAAAAFPPGLFSEYAWDMLLVMFAAQEQGRDADEDELIEAIGIGGATVQRWLSYLEDKEQIVLVEVEGGRIPRLTPAANHSMQTFLDYAVAELTPEA